MCKWPVTEERSVRARRLHSMHCERACAEAAAQLGDAEIGVERQCLIEMVCELPHLSVHAVLRFAGLAVVCECTLSSQFVCTLSRWRQKESLVPAAPFPQTTPASRGCESQVMRDREMAVVIDARIRVRRHQTSG